MAAMKEKEKASPYTSLVYKVIESQTTTNTLEKQEEREREKKKAGQMLFLFSVARRLAICGFTSSAISG